MASRPAKTVLMADVPGEDMCQERSIHAEHVVAVRHNLLSTDKAMGLAALFGVLSDPTRLQVLYALLKAPTGELCVCDLASALGRDDTTISHQLRVLRNTENRGKGYSVRRGMLEAKGRVVLFTDAEITDYRSTLRADRAKLGRFTRLLRGHGVFRGDSKFYLSIVHDQRDVDETIRAFASAVEELRG